jgi:cytochrome P450
MTTTSGSLLDPGVQQWPFPFFEQLRQQGPVVFMPELGVYYISSYDVCRQVLLDAKRFVKSPPEKDGRRYVEPSKAAQRILIEKDVGTPLNCIGQSEGAQHRAYRKVVDARFLSARVKQMEDPIRAMARTLIDGFEAQGECDAVAAFSVPLPLYVIADILGIPTSEHRTYRKWSDAVLTYVALVVPEEQAIAGAETMVEMHRYLLEQVRQRRESPTNDLLTVLALARCDDDRPLTDREICGFTDELLVAGNETTGSVISASLLHLASHPDAQQRLRSDRQLIPNFVEEMLRTATPLQLTLRYAVTDVTLGGVSLPAGAKIFVGMACANRDEHRFDAPENVDIERKNARANITFGGGDHFCLGADLARLELRIAIQEWLIRFSFIRLNQPPDSIRYPAGFTVRGPKELELSFERAA